MEEEPKADAGMVQEVPVQPTLSGRVLLEAGIAPTYFSHSHERAITQPGGGHPQTRNTLLKHIFLLDWPRIGNLRAEEGINMASPRCDSSTLCNSNTFPLSWHMRRILSRCRPPVLPMSPGTATGLSQTRLTSSSSLSIPVGSFCLRREMGKGQRGTSEPWPSYTGSRHWL